MDSATYFGEHLAATRLMGIFRNLDPDRTVEMCERAWDAGVLLVEIQVQTPDALPSLRAAVSAARSRGARVGAGTVISVEQVTAVHDLGVEFTVAPGLHPPVVAESERLGLPHLPGVATATEIATALASGFTWLKAFPARQLGPGWISAQLGPFPEVNFVATGGVDASNAAAFLEAGSRAVGVGTALAEDPESLTRLLP